MTILYRWYHAHLQGGSRKQTWAFQRLLCPSVKRTLAQKFRNLQPPMVNTEVSQNHRIPWVGRDLSESPVQPPAKAGSRQQVAQESIHVDLQYLRGESSTSPGSLSQCSGTLKLKKFFLVFVWNFLCSNLCPLSLVLLLGTTENSLAPCAWHLPIRYL